MVLNEPWFRDYEKANKEAGEHHQRKLDERDWFKPVDRRKENEYMQRLFGEKENSIRKHMQAMRMLSGCKDKG